MNPGAGIALAALFGLLFGSFLNVCIVRWPALESVVRPRSRCPRCHALIAWYDNIPVISWLMLRARCRHCGLSIPWRYPAVELATGLIWVTMAVRFGWSVDALRGAIFVTILLGIAVSDYREYIIPDEFSLGGAVIGLLLAGLTGWRGSVFTVDPRQLTLLPALVGAAAAFGLLWLVAWIGSKTLGEEAMGGGDIKMMALIGSFLGFPGALLTLFAGAVLGTLVFLPLKLVGRGRLVPFGVFLAVAAALAWMWQTDAIDWYRNWMRI